MSKDQIYCNDISQAINEIESFIANLDFGKFLNDRKTQMAVARELEIIGEATKKLSQEFKEKHKDIPWRQIAGMRDFLIHDYRAVDLKKIWNAATKDIQELKLALG